MDRFVTHHRFNQYKPTKRLLSKQIEACLLIAMGDRASISPLIKVENQLILRKSIIEGTNEDWLEVCDLGDKGRGVRAAKRFAREEFIVEYKGTLLVCRCSVRREFCLTEEGFRRDRQHQGGTYSRAAIRAGHKHRLLHVLLQAQRQELLRRRHR